MTLLNLPESTNFILTVSTIVRSGHGSKKTYVGAPLQQYFKTSSCQRECLYHRARNVTDSPHWLEVDVSEGRVEPWIRLKIPSSCENSARVKISIFTSQDYYEFKLLDKYRSTYDSLLIRDLGFVHWVNVTMQQLCAGRLGVAEKNIYVKDLTVDNKCECSRLCTMI